MTKITKQTEAFSVMSKKFVVKQEVSTKDESTSKDPAFRQTTPKEAMMRLNGPAPRTLI